MQKSRVNLKSAILASIVGTIAMTVVMAIFGINIMKALGMTAGMQGGMVYFIGGLIHLSVGIFYGIIYAWIFQPLLKKLPSYLSGAVYSILPFIIAMLFMSPFLNAIQTVFRADRPATTMCGANPCNPCMPKAKPSNPCAPCNPCMPKAKKMSYNPCKPCKGSNPCNPCSAGDNRFGWIFSLISHLVYGIALGWIYRPKAV